MDSGERFDVAVVGSGAGGLFAALRAAQLGARVVMIEAGKQLGGYLAPFRRAGYTFDPGLHYLGECGPGEAMARALDELGLGDAVRFRAVDEPGFDRLQFPGYEVVVPRGAERYEARLADDFPAEREGLRGFFAEIAACRAAQRELRAAGGGPPWPRWFVERARLTFGELIARHVEDPLLRAVLGAQCGNYALSPGRASALVGVGVLAHFLDGAWFPIGGGGALRDALVEAFARAGGVTVRGDRVAAIELRGGRVEGVRCASGRRFDADAVVSNADAVTTYLELVGVDNLPPRLARRASRTVPSVASFGLFLGTRRDPKASGLGEANVGRYASADLEAEYAPLLRGELPSTTSCFVSSPSAKGALDLDAAVDSPRHTVVLVALVPFAPFAKWADTRALRRGDDYARLKATLADRYRSALEAIAPGVLDGAEVIEAATPLTNHAFALARSGGAYGPAHTPDQMGPSRFGVASPVPGLFLAGASAAYAGVVACALSGLAAGARAVEASRKRAGTLSRPAAT